MRPQPGSRAAFPRVSVSVSGDPTVVVGDSLALGVVVENLLRNAVEAASTTGGSVRVQRRGDDGRRSAWWSRTTGPGSPRSFASASSSRSCPANPRGARPGAGAAFRAAARRRRRVRAPEGRRRPLRRVAAAAGCGMNAPVLVVEDRRMLGEMLAETLRKEGYEVELVDARRRGGREGDARRAVPRDGHRPQAPGRGRSGGAARRSDCATRSCRCS